MSSGMCLYLRRVCVLAGAVVITCAATGHERIAYGVLALEVVALALAVWWRP